MYTHHRHIVALLLCLSPAGIGPHYFDPTALLGKDAVSLFAGYLTGIAAHAFLDVNS
jgi:general stress protein CsbA